MFRGIPPSLTVLAFLVLTSVYWLALTYIPTLKERELNKMRKSLMLAGISIIAMLLFFLGVTAIG